MDRLDVLPPKIIYFLSHAEVKKPTIWPNSNADRDLKEEYSSV